MLSFGVLFTGSISIILLVVIISYSDFRRDEFHQRLRDMAITTFAVFVESDTVDRNLQQLIDRNVVEELYDESTIIMDSDGRLLYNSQAALPEHLTMELRQEIFRKGEVYQAIGESELIGLKIQGKGLDYLVFVQAYDKYGHRKLTYLRNLLLGTAGLGSLLTMIAALIITQRLVSPIQKLTTQIQAISERNLQSHVFVSRHHDEVTVLAESFNQLMDRLEKAFAVQRTFVQHASHELRTPLAALIAQTELALKKQSLNEEEVRKLLNILLNDQRYLAELTNSLLLLSQFEAGSVTAKFESFRLDETIMKCLERVGRAMPEIRFHFEYGVLPNDETELCLLGNEILISSAIENLLKNAGIYSGPEKKVSVRLYRDLSEFHIQVENHGAVIPDSEKASLFQPFYRGRTSTGKKGYGLGLPIAMRIAKLHQGNIRYESPALNLNRFTLIIPVSLV